MATFRRSADVQSTPVGDRLVLFHRGTGSSIVLNPTASILWAALDHAVTTGDLAEELCQRHVGLSLEQAIEDVTRCLEEFAVQSLVTADG